MTPFQKTISVETAISGVQDGSVLMFGGFGGVGSPPSLIEAILDSGVTDLTVICNDAGFPEIGIGPLIVNQRVKTLIASHIGSNPVAGKQMTDGTLDVQFSPQGTLAERIRAGGAGLGGILTDIGIANQMVYEKKDIVSVAGKRYLVEEALTADFAFVNAHIADEFGNLTYDKTARNMNPLMAMAASRTFVEAERIVPMGEISEEMIVTPGVFVEGVVRSEGVKWKWAWE
ncbi:CoA transferase subunit A [Bacillus subtilis]|nr:CoA transferase subunit A [Bacillus subtilis]TYS11467.1 CoA transferase subunit A [Bacillus subtilis]